MIPSRALLRLLLIICFAVLHSTFVQAADIEVGASCSLADAITAANRDAPRGGCPPGRGADTITLSGNVTLDAELPRLTSDMTIQGKGHTISGDNTFPIFKVYEGDIALHDVTLTEGQSSPGGGGGAVDLKRSARMTISNSSLIANQAKGYGGAIFVADEAMLDIANTTISGNKAIFGGALAMMHQAQVTLTHVTITNNSTSYLVGGIYMILQPVYAGDGNFRPDRAQVNLRNSIVAGNDGGDCYARLNQNIGNLIGDGSCIAAESGDPKLDELSPELALHELRDGSPAVDSADAEHCLPSDQRGAARPHGSACDIGAIESRSASAAPPKPEASVCTLADQIRAANTDQVQGACPAGSGADTIDLTADVTLNAALPPVTSELSINGHGYTISGNHSHRFFNVQGGKLELRDMTLTEGYSTTMASVIYLLDGELELTNVEIVHNRAEVEGAIANEFGAMVIDGSSFRNNLGTVIVNGGHATITGSIFRHNVGYFSGAIQNRGVLDARNVEIVDNFAEGWGAALVNEGTLSLVDSKISGNADEGLNTYSAIIYNSGRLTITGNDIVGNKANSDEEVTYNFLGDLIEEDNTFSGNRPDVGWEGPSSD